MNGSDRELDELMNDWQAAEAAVVPDTAAILRQVKRRSLGLKVVTLSEIAIVTAALTGLTLFAVHHPDPFDVAAMAALGLLAVGALAFALWNRRGQWRPTAESTAAYLAIARSRARRRRTALRFSRWLLAAETAVFIPWIAYTLRTGQADRSGWLSAYAFLALIVGVMSVAVVVLERWTRREMAALVEVEEVS